MLNFAVPPSIRLLAIDIDGTLLNSQFRIAQGDLDALRRARESDVEVILVTGRRHTFALPMAQQLGFDLWLISSNGTITRTLAREAFHHDLMPAVTCGSICLVMRKFSGNVVLTSDEDS